MVQEHDLGPHHVCNGDDREVETIGLAGFGICGFGPCGALTAANHVRTDDKKPVGIDGKAGTDHPVPPAFFSGLGVRIGRMLVQSQGMANQDDIGFVAVECSISVIGLCHRAQFYAAVERQGTVTFKGYRLIFRVQRVFARLRCCLAALTHCQVAFSVGVCGNCVIGGKTRLYGAFQRPPGMVLAPKMLEKAE